MRASLGPQIVLSPQFAVFYSELRGRLPTPSAVSVTARSTLVVSGDGDVTIEGLVLDGALEIKVRRHIDAGRFSCVLRELESCKACRACVVI